MTDERFQDDELEFDDEFVLEDVELDADEFLDEPEDADPAAAPAAADPPPLESEPSPRLDQPLQAEASEEVDAEADDSAAVPRTQFGMADPGFAEPASEPATDPQQDADVLGAQPAGSTASEDPFEDAWELEDSAEPLPEDAEGFVGQPVEVDALDRGAGDPDVVDSAEPETQSGAAGSTFEDPLGWGSTDDAPLDASPLQAGPEQDLFDASASVGSDEVRFDESGGWNGVEASFDEIVGEAETVSNANAWSQPEDDSEFDVDDLEALDAVEIERLDDDELEPLEVDEPESMLDLVESASSGEPVFDADEALPELDEEDDPSFEPMPSLSLEGLDLDDTDPSSIDPAAPESERRDPTVDAGAGWDLTVRSDGSPMAEPDAPESLEPEPFVIEDQAAAEEAEAAEHPGEGSFGSGRFDQPFANNPVAGMMEMPEGEGWESMELGVSAGAGDETNAEDQNWEPEPEAQGEESWDVQELAPDEDDPEAADEDDPIYGEEAMAAGAGDGAEGADWDQDHQDREADWSELEENYVDEQADPEIQVIGGPGSQRRRGSRWAAAAAVLLVGLGGAAGTIGWLHPEWLGLEEGSPVGVERTAVARPQLDLDLAAPALEVRVADAGGEPVSTEPDPVDPDGPTLPGGPTGPDPDPVDPTTGPETGGAVVHDEPETDPDQLEGDPETAGPPVTEPATGADPMVAETPAGPAFAPIEVGESLEMRGPATDAAPGMVDAVRVGMRAWAQLSNEAVFIGTVRRIEASYVTLRMDTGEITLDREEIVAILPVGDAERDPVEIEHGFVRLGEHGTLFGRILRNNGGEHVILETLDSRVSLPLETIDSVGVRTDAGIVVVPDDDDWLEERARRRLSGLEGRDRESGQPTKTGGDEARTRPALPVLPAGPLPQGGR